MLEDSIRSKGYRDVIAKGRAQGLVVIGLTLDETGAPLKRDMRSSLVLQMMEMDPAEEPTNSISGADPAPKYYRIENDKNRRKVFTEKNGNSSASFSRRIAMMNPRAIHSVNELSL
jgi:hypothetical protein